MSEQTWQIAVTPKERWNLYLLANAKEQKIKGGEGRKYRRFLRAFGLMALQDEINSNGKLGTRQTTDKKASAFTITAETRDHVKNVLIPQERTPIVETILGDLFDRIEDLKDGEQPQLPEGIEPYDATKEDWKAEDDERADLLDELNEALTGFDKDGSKIEEPLANAGVTELIDHAKRMKGVR
jgi:hypothetical protein